MRRLTVVVAAALLALTACTGGGDDDAKDRDEGSLPLPAKAPSARGPATGPQMQPKVLLAASDDLEELTGAIDTAQVQRRTGAFVSGRTVVGYSVDDISGYDLTSGKKRWTASLDLGGGTVCFASQPDRAVKTFTVAYGDASYCPNVATIRVSDGKVVMKSDKLNGLVEYQGESAGGAIDHLFTVKGQDFLVDMRGVVWKMVAGEPDPIARLEDDSYFALSPTPDGDVLIGSRLSDRGRCRVDGYELPSFDHAWTEENKTLFPDAPAADCIISAAPRSAAWLSQETGDRYYLTQVDPTNGKVLGTAEAAKDSGGKAAAGTFDLASASNQIDQALGLPGGDTVFAQVRGLTRYSLAKRKVVWDLDLSQVQLASDEDFPLTDVLPQGVTADGYLVATISNNTSAEVIAVDVKTGKLRARWAVPEEYHNGFQVDPGAALFGGGIVLTRNFESWQRAFADYLDVKKPTGDIYDIGVFTFPPPADKASPAVPTVGPVDTQATALGGLATPKGADGDRNAGAVSAGSRVVAWGGATVAGLDPKTGKKAWTFDVDDDPAARVCDVGEPDRAVKTVTIAYRGGAKGSTCDSIVRLAVADGSVVDRLTLPKSAKTAARIRVHEGVVYVVTGDRKVGRFVDGALVPVATLAHQPYSFEGTPEDPSLVITTSSVDGGRDWAIDAYRMPSFERVWSTKATTVLTKVDPANIVEAWHGNGLWISTTLGDLSDPEAKVEDSLAQLDPDTGRVVGRTGKVKRRYRQPDLTTFTLNGAASSGYLTAGFADGDVVLPQDGGVMRYSLTDRSIRWATDTTSIMASMERDRGGSIVDQRYDLVDGGKTVLVTMSNDTSVELMTLDAGTGRITGRWNVPKAFRNGLQASPDVTPFPGGVALTRSDYSWDYAFRQSDREVPADQLYDVGLFRFTKPKPKPKG